MNLLFIVLLLMAISCTPRRSLEGGDIERRYVRESVEPPLAVGSEMLKIFEGDYAFYISQNRRDRVVCKGDAKIEQFEFHTKTTGVAKCEPLTFRIAGSQEIKIEDISEGFAKAADSLPHQDNRITRISQLGQSEQGKILFEPSFPTFIGPIFQDIEKFKDIDERQAFDIIFPPGHINAGRHSGEIHVKTLEIHGCKDHPSHFFPDHKDVIRVQMNIVSGFQKLKVKSKYGLYNVYELCIKTNPLAVVHVHIEGDASDFVDGGVSGKLGDFATKGILADLELLRHTSF
jgi:hypothetical protein